MRMRYILSLGAASLILATMAVRAEEAPKLKVPEVKIDTKAQKDAENKISAAKKEAASATNAVKKDAESKMKQTKEQSADMQKQQMKKTEEIKKETAKGSEKGQDMREEHSKKWWKFWGEKTPETAK